VKTGPARILVVDDDPLLVEALATAARSHGHEAIVATTPADALRHFRESRPDLVFLDVVMPTLDGFKLARLMKADGGSFVPIILVTGLDDLESKRRGMAAGADDFLTKPVNPVELEIRLTSMLRIKELTDQLQEANARLAQLAVTDPLTGLANRRALYAHLDREIDRAKRYKHPLAVLVIDIDHFKAVNDGHGHQTGDRVLVLVAQVITQSVRASDVAGRFGGEEFIVLAPETPPQSMKVVAERIRRAVEAQTAAQKGLPGVTVSIGAAGAVDGEGTVEAIVARADAALYEAKRGGRNRVVIAE
jgi:two-component system cell cycle response regulator